VAHGAEKNKKFGGSTQWSMGQGEKTTAARGNTCLLLGVEKSTNVTETSHAEQDLEPDPLPRRDSSTFEHGVIKSVGNQTAAENRGDGVRCTTNLRHQWND